jgi:hypothetical protein
MAMEKTKTHTTNAAKKLLRSELPSEIKKELKELVNTLKGYDPRLLQAAISDALTAHIRLYMPPYSETIEESEKKHIKSIRIVAKRLRRERDRLRPKINKALDELLPNSGYSPHGQACIRSLVDTQLERGAECAFRKVLDTPF